MDQLQLSALRTVMSGPRPRVVWKKIERVAAASISPSVPKISGLLCVQVIWCIGANAVTPATPTGFTSLNSSASAITTYGIRVVYKFLNGSEALSLASAAAGSTKMMSLSYLIAGCCPAYVPAGTSTGMNNATSHTPAAANATAGGSGRLVLSGATYDGTVDVVGTPSVPFFDPTTRLLNSSGADVTFGYEAISDSNNTNVTGSFEFSGAPTIGGRSFTVTVRGG